MSVNKRGDPGPLEMPVSVLMECREVTSGRWSEEQWDVISVVAGEQVAPEQARTPVLEEPGRRQYLWTGLKIRLYKDGCESYWYNLMSDTPFLFVVCFRNESEDGEEEVNPVLVTANQDEATGHIEIDDPVYSVPMPEKVHQWVERFVVENYVPEAKRKRKRKNWTEEAEHAEAPARSAPGSKPH